MKLYHDSVIAIYMVEKPPAFAPAVDRALRSLNPMGYDCTELTRSGSLILPRRNGDLELESDFEWFFGQSFVRFVPMTRSVFDRSVDLRTKYRFLKTPDSLHLAAAIGAASGGFLTNDLRLNAISEIPIHLI